MRVYITKWALKRGIVETEAALATTKSQDVLVLPNGMTFFTGEWFVKLEDAEEDFEERKAQRVSKLRIQAKLLELRKPKVVRMEFKSVCGSKK